MTKIKPVASLPVIAKQLSKIIFLGTPEFGAIILEGLIKNEYKPILVVTAPDKPVGRKQIITSSPVKITAQKYNILVFQPEKIKNIIPKIRKLNPDLIIVAAYSQILPKEILEIPKYGSLNVHPSLLPKYRGPSPIHYAILNGEKETGVTIILMDEKIDHGPILAQRELEISNKATYKKLEEELAKLSIELLIEIIPKWIKDEIKTKPQDESKAIFTKILRKEDGKIDWKKPADYIERQIRAFNPWPSAFSGWETTGKYQLIKIFKAEVLKQTENGPSGFPGKTFLAPDEKIAVQCGKDFLVIEELQPEGKKKMSAKEFLRGHPDFIGLILK